MIKYYFGTDTKEKGHFMREIYPDGKDLGPRSLRFDFLPFDPERVNQGMANGDINYQHHKSRHGEFTVCAITGSCIDSRQGCRSVFIAKGIIDFGEMQRMIMETPCCKEIIEKMPFKINW